MTHAVPRGRRGRLGQKLKSTKGPPTMFSEFKEAIDAQWHKMRQYELFRTGADKDTMWTIYLGSFPEGSNPIFRTRTEHDCSCCRQFVRAAGNVVAIIDGRLTSLWEVEVANPAFQQVAMTMAALVKEQPIDNVFLHTKATAGTDKNHEQTETGVRTWEHFFVRLPNSRVVTGVQIGPKLSETRALHDVLLRSLIELKPDAVDTTLELIGQNSLYRGEEHKHALTTFRQAQAAYAQQSPEARDAFVWSQIDTLPGSVSKKLTLTPTATVDTVGGKIQARIWKGTTEDGVPVKAWIAVIAPQTADEAQLKAFGEALKQVPASRELTSFDIRLAI